MFEDNDEGFMGAVGMDFDELEKGMEDWQKGIEELCEQW